MRTQLGFSLVKDILLVLPYRLKGMGVALGEWIWADNQSAHTQFAARRLDQAATMDKEASKSIGVVDKKNMPLDNQTSLSMAPEDVPMHHLFLLDMKIGR